MSEILVPEYSLRQRQSLPLEMKVKMSLRRIEQWYKYWRGDVTISFSGGKDSTVLLHLVRSKYPEVPAVFADTGLEFPENRSFVKKAENVIWVRPKKLFPSVLEVYGYPVISKHVAQCVFEIRTGNKKLRHIRLYGKDPDTGKESTRSKLPAKWRFLLDAPFKISHRCCYYLKKEPLNRCANCPFLGNLCSEAKAREINYKRHGCNNYDSSKPKSSPLSFWMPRDIDQYIQENEIEISPLYSMGWEGSGCMFCAFGVHMEEGPNRFQRMKITHPKLYDYCVDRLGMGKVLEYINIPYGKYIPSPSLWRKGEEG